MQPLNALSAASRRAGLSALFAATITRRPEARRKLPTSSSRGVSPSLASTTQTMSAASSTTVRTCARMSPSNTPTFLALSGTPKPPVSTRRKDRP